MDLLEHCTWRAKPGEVRTEQASQNDCRRGQATLLGGCKHKSFTYLGAPRANAGGLKIIVA